MALKNFTEDENHKTVQELYCSAELCQRCRERAYIPFSHKYFSFRHCFSWEHSDPSCSARQGYLTSSAVQTPVS